MKQTLITLILVLATFIVFGQDAADTTKEAPAFFDRSSFISMGVGALVGALAYVFYFRKKKKK